MTEQLLGSVLVRNGHLSPDQLAEACARASRDAAPLGDVLASLGYVSPADLLQAIGDTLGYAVVTLAEMPPDPAAVGLVPREFALRRQALPLALEEGTLTVALANPLDLQLVDDLRLATGMAIRPVIAPPAEIRRALEQFAMEQMIQDVSDGEGDAGADEGADIADLQKMAREALVVQLVNMLIHQAVQERASDIHVEPFERELRVRYRIDGVLREASTPPKRLQSAIISRIKILAEMNIAERRLPQDGRIRLRVSGRQIDIRVSSLPTLYGESVVMRILDKGTALLGLEELGMPSEPLTRFRKLIGRPHGILLVTGPTGSGKTTSLYAALAEIYSEQLKIITIEDPVEYQLPGINQIHVRSQIGLTFASGLRSIVRQDPDVIMVGEIRDSETAEIAIQAALTGHLVFSTLHTNDAAGAITRLLDMGAEPYLVASSLIGSVAQRLVRQICPQCKAPAEYSDAALREVGIDPAGPDRHQLRRGAGCDACGRTGYRRRLGVFEMLTIDDAVRQMIVERTPANLIKQHGVNQQGMQTLLMDGRQKALTGLTTVEEVLRVCQADQL
jgi:type II secretion system protein E